MNCSEFALVKEKYYFKIFIKIKENKNYNVHKNDLFDDVVNNLQTCYT